MVIKTNIDHAQTVDLMSDEASPTKKGRVSMKKMNLDLAMVMAQNVISQAKAKSWGPVGNFILIEY